jgi:hypothetical protein
VIPEAADDANPSQVEDIIEPPQNGSETVNGTQLPRAEATQEGLANAVNRLEREEENKGLKEDNENLLRNLHDIHEQIKPLQTELDDRLNKVSFQIDKQVEWNKVAFQIGNARNKLNQFVSPKGKKSQGVGAIVSEVQNSHKEAEISYHEFKEKHASDSVLDTALRDIEAQIKRLEPEKDLTSRHRFPTFVTVPRLIYTLAIFGIGILIGYFALPDAPSVTETQNTETPVTESPEQSAQMTVGQLIEKVQLEISAEPNPTNKGYSIQIRLPNLGQINAAYIGRLKADETIAAGYMKEPPQLQERKNLRFIFKDDFYELDVKESGLSGGFVWLSWIQGISNEITNQNGVETRQTVIQIEYQGKDPLIIPKEFKIYTQTDQ